MPKHPELDERERHLDETLIHASGMTPAQYAAEHERRLAAARRLRLLGEDASYRR